MEDFLSNLKVVATSPYALVGYLILIGAWVVVSISNSRLKNIAASLKDIPEAERAKILEKNFGIHLKEGMSADKYISARKSSYYFYIASIAILALLIGYLAWLQKANSSPPDEEAKNFCDKTLLLANDLEENFKSSIGKKTGGTAKEVEYTSKNNIPNGRFSNIQHDTEDDTYTYFTSFYTGEDSEIAGKVFTKTISLFEKCLPEWFETNGALDKDHDDGSYVTFVEGDRKIILQLSGPEEDDDLNYVICMITLTPSALERRKTPIKTKRRDKVDRLLTLIVCNRPQAEHAFNSANLA